MPLMSERARALSAARGKRKSGEFLTVGSMRAQARPRHQLQLRDLVELAYWI
jgi:hypothetical protein